MTMPIVAVIQISADYNPGTQLGTWYALTDHNRAPIAITPQRLELSQRMANGTMRKYVVANKKVLDISWKFVPSASTTITTQSGKTVPSFAPTVDGNYGAGFMKAFYEQYVFSPIYVKLTYAKDNATGTGHASSVLGGSEIIQVFITDFKYTVINRFTLSDYVDIDMQFTEV
jgi:hypothetical protein